MKKIITVIVVVFLAVLSVNAQEKKIKFNKGILSICSAKNFQIEGYDGNEVIIKSLHDSSRYMITKVKATKNVRFSSKENLKNQFKKGTFYTTTNGRLDSLPATRSNSLFFSRTDFGKKEGLKRLGKKQENKELGIYFIIEQKNEELVFRDNDNGQMVMFGNEKYIIKIPNSLKLKWDTSNCKKTNQNRSIFYSNKTSSLSNFNGEVELTTSLSNFKLTDVTGPVSINSIGGNVTVSFDKKLPLKLYSVYTNNGFIDITMPSNSDVNVEANASAIYSDLAFNVLQDSESDGQQHMKLKLKRGKVKMKLEAGFGTVYLRKK
ncbi:hypothetical protein KCTC32516_02224 [Polaribacter huanghezhanensis]|uniref:hypothetical protein n=1 Tax=Polaribacter huanghezhanensis TaxID=1354726 RepID=UPI002647AECC|nr:hypothetical protein [Polaribacter huanghezhanensis]WKD86844.1 hypothetical protein KCTC32516_02224 [Polaribacter huanghezhanensis]